MTMALRGIQIHDYHTDSIVSLQQQKKKWKEEYSSLLSLPDNEDQKLISYERNSHYVPLKTAKSTDLIEHVDIDLRGGFELLVKVWDRGRRNEGTMTLVRSSDMIRGMQLSPNGSYILHGMVGTLCYTGLRPFCIKDNGKGHPAQTWKTNNGHSVSAPDVSKVTAGSSDRMVYI
ncbi:hypothetical protein Tco_0285198 [Tanacetum coccineum]